MNSLCIPAQVLETLELSTEGKEELWLVFYYQTLEGFI